MVASESPELMRPEQVMAMFGIKRTTLFRLIKSGEVRSFRTGGIRLVRVDSIREWADRQEAAWATEGGAR